MTSASHSARPSLPPPSSDAPKESFWHDLWAVSAGLLLGLALLKFGNPVIFYRLIERPSGIWEVIFQPWPISWGYWLLGVLALMSLKTIRISLETPAWIACLPLPWLIWQGIAATNTVDPKLTRATLFYFGSCVLWFYLGLLGLCRLWRSMLFWIALMPGFIIALWIGFEQHYGGLEATRRFLYEQPNWREYPAEYLKRIASDRIFSTLVYPNAFAGAIILYLPVALSVVWRVTERLPSLVRNVLTGLVGYLGLACLFWSGSKAGWLIALLMGTVSLGQLPMSKTTKRGIAILVIAIGFVGFAVRFSSYFQKGATSVAARLEYWRAAAVTFRKNPVLGTGPGTFSVAYAKIKPPNAEMARLTHNDYLEQASDSGILGFLSYLGFIAGTIILLYRNGRSFEPWFALPISLGLLGWSVQSLVEFPLYIPGLAWPAFAFMGAMCGRFEKTEPNGQL